MSTELPEDHLVPLLKHALAQLNARIAKALEPYGIEGREWVVLTTLDGAPPMSQQEAAAILRVDRTTMVALVDGLEAKGLVDRRAHPDDRRKNVVELTDAGRKTLRSAGRAGEAAEREFLIPLDERGVRQLKTALKSLDSDRSGH